MAALAVELSSGQLSVLNNFNWLWLSPRDLAIWDPIPSHIIVANDANKPKPAPWRKTKKFIAIINYQLRHIITYDGIGLRNEHTQAKDAYGCSVDGSVKAESSLVSHSRVLMIRFEIRLILEHKKIITSKIVWTCETRRTIPKFIHPNKIATPLVILVAVWSSMSGKKGRIKSSNTIRATEFKPLDKELLRRKLRK